jgi:beta-phosphoglucomutase
MKALLWDMNGVLIHDEPLQEEAWKEALEIYGFPYTHEWYQTHFLGRKVAETLDIVFPQLTEAERTALIMEKRRHYNAATALHLPAGPGALKKLKEAHVQGITQALVSSNIPEAVSLALNTLDVREYFEVVISGAHVSNSKPHPECFLLAAEKLQVNPEDCWVIEDSLFGIEAAHQANMKCVALTTSLSQEALSHAEIVTDTLSVSLLAELVSS